MDSNFIKRFCKTDALLSLNCWQISHFKSWPSCSSQYTQRGLFHYSAKL